MRLFKLPKKFRGFTLIEVLVYTFILGILATMVSSILFQIFRLQSVITDRATLSDNIKNVYKVIRDDMYLSDVLFVDGNDLVLTSSFSTPQTIRYSLSGSTIVRSEDGGTAVAVTDSKTDVFNFALQDLTTTSAAELVRITIGVRNYDAGLLKPPITSTTSATMSLKFVI